MKCSSLNKLPLLLMIILFVNSCVEANDFEVPDIAIAEINIEGIEITINTLRGLLIQEQNNNENNFLSFSETDQFISGYVISNDEAGNFFKELILQDATSNPTTGVKILVDVNPLFTSYEFGRKIYVNLDGLTVGFDSGVLTLGIRDGGSVEKISESQTDRFIIRDSVVANIIPLPITREEFSSEKTNLFVQLENVQFRIDEVIGEDRKTFAAEPTDEFDGERRLVFCSNRRSVIFISRVERSYLRGNFAKWRITGSTIKPLPQPCPFLAQVGPSISDNWVIVLLRFKIISKNDVGPFFIGHPTIQV